MTTILGPYTYSGVAFTDTETQDTLASLISQTDPVYIKLIHAEDQTRVYLDLKKIATFDNTFPNYLSDGVVAFLNGWYVPSTNQKGLETLYGDPNAKDVDDSMASGVIYSFNPVLDAALSVLPISINAPTTPTTNYTIDNKNDLVISGARDLSNALTFVNGVFHNSIYWNKAQYIIDGLYSFRQTQKLDIQCYDTTQLGGHTVVPITADMCAWDDDHAGVIITLPAGMSFAGKSVFNTVDGYLFYPGEVLSIKNDTVAFLHTCRIPFIEQWRHNPLTKKKADMIGANWNWGTPNTQPAAPPVVTGGYRSINQQSDLELFTDKRSVPYASVNTDTFKWNRITSPHSALILVNKATVTHNVISPYPIQVTGRYGVFMDAPPQGITRYGCGLSPSFVSTSGNNKELWIHIDQPDYDIGRLGKVLNPDCVPALFPQMEECLDVPFHIHVFS